MSTITATNDFVYTLEYGLIYRQKTNGPEQKSLYEGPSGIYVQVMASNLHLYVLRDDGTSARRSHTGEGSWEEFEVPAGTTHLSSSDHDIYALATFVYYRHDEPGNVFVQIVEMDRNDIIQLDHDEQYSYALTTSGDIYVAPTYGAWSLYPESLPNIEQIVASLTYLYARNDTGSVFRSQHIGFSGWSRLDERDNIIDMAIETTHMDRFWFVRSGLQFRNPPDWIGGVRPESWVRSGWVEPGWVRSEP